MSRPQHLDQKDLNWSGFAKTITCLSVVFSLILLSPRAQAISVPWGDPVLSHSWEQLWVETLDQTFDSLTAKIILPPGSEFEAPGFSGFSAADWVVQSISARDVLAQGADATRLEFRTHFVGLPSDYSSDNPLVFDLRFFNDGNQVDGHRWIWDGTSWTDPQPPVVGAVPDGGASLVLLGFSALGLAWFRRRSA
jgi:hypothetical protein